MDITKILSGYDLVEKGATKIEATLPEIGLKNIFRNNTWLEEKQIQSALEARKHLVGVERIEKSGVLSHGHWREDLMLVEVTKKVGGHWQYLGHNVGKTLFLYPEEALFLIEVNCLCLKHNHVQVSLQQAYNILLRGKIKLHQYKVYAFLSRLGYRVYRHKQLETTANKKNNSTNTNDSKGDDIENVHNGKEETEKLCNINTEFISTAKNENSAQNKEDADAPHDTLTEYTEIEQTGSRSGTNVGDVNREKESLEKCTGSCGNKKFDIPSINNKSIDLPIRKKQVKHKTTCTTKKLQRLKCRRLKPCNYEVINKYFDGTPDLSNGNIVTIRTPEKRLIPATIDLNKPNYKINLENVRNRRAITASTETNMYSPSDEANGSHIRRLRNSSANECRAHLASTHVRHATRGARASPAWWGATRQPFGFFNAHMSFRRSFLPGWVFSHNFHFLPRHYAPFWRQNINTTGGIRSADDRSETGRTARRQHIERIRKSAHALKRIILSGDTENENIYSLQRSINAYNVRYETKVRLDERFDIIVDETMADAAELDEDEEPRRKRRRRARAAEHLAAVKETAARLRELHGDRKCSSEHRRAFAELLKTFNRSYGEDYHLDENHQLVYRNRVDLDSSGASDADCASEGAPSAVAEGKKLKNPFNILKRLSETPLADPSSSTDRSPSTEADRYGASILGTFAEDWLPPENDFGRPEIVSEDSADVDGADSKREEFVYDFLKIRTHEYDNWLDLKRSYFGSIEAAIAEFRGDSSARPAGGRAARGRRRALRVVRNETSAAEECELAVDFDVHERSVKNFKKTNRPTPHFRIICLHESSALPAGAQVAALHARADGVATVFAVVGLAAVSFLQIKPSDLPLYTPNNTSL